jgi:hypothetical protein
VLPNQCLQELFRVGAVVSNRMPSTVRSLKQKRKISFPSHTQLLLRVFNKICRISAAHCQKNTQAEQQIILIYRSDLASSRYVKAVASRSASVIWAVTSDLLRTVGPPMVTNSCNSCNEIILMKKNGEKREHNPILHCIQLRPFQHAELRAQRAQARTVQRRACHGIRVRLHHAAASNC